MGRKRGQVRCVRSTPAGRSGKLDLPPLPLPFLWPNTLAYCLVGRYTTFIRKVELSGGWKDVSEEAASERREVYYSGRVQGVGFRFTVRSIATRFGVTGFVQNLRDGRVQLVAEGHADDLRRLLDAVDAEMGHCITEKRQQIAPTSGRFQTFEIRF